MEYTLGRIPSILHLFRGCYALSILVREPDRRINSWMDDFRGHMRRVGIARVDTSVSGRGRHRRYHADMGAFYRSRRIFGGSVLYDPRSALRSQHCSR